MFRKTFDRSLARGPFPLLGVPAHLADPGATLRFELGGCGALLLVLAGWTRSAEVDLAWLVRSHPAEHALAAAALLAVGALVRLQVRPGAAAGAPASRVRVRIADGLPFAPAAAGAAPLRTRLVLPRGRPARALVARRRLG